MHGQATRSWWARSGLRLAAHLALIGLSLSGSLAHALDFGEPNEDNLDRHGRYTSRSDGRSVHQPAKTKDGSQPSGATARCRDGTWSFSHTHRGTCSRHGGVVSWLR